MVTLQKREIRPRSRAAYRLQKRILGRAFLKNQGRFLGAHRSEIIDGNEMQAALFRYSFAYNIFMGKIMQ
jgi:uncharacterized protein YprB with RNaseH-like and TPR domain